MNAYARFRSGYVIACAAVIATLFLLVTRCEGGYQLQGTPGSFAKFVTASTIGDSASSETGGVFVLGANGLRYSGHLVIGPSGALYSGPSTVAVTHSSGLGAVNLTTEGTLDWYRVDTVWPPCGDVSLSVKASGGRYLECDAVTLAQSGCATSSGTDASMTYALTAGDSTDSAPTTGNARYQALLSGPTTAPWGFRLIVKTPATQALVARVYWAQDPGMTVTCSATLPDGTTATDAGITGTTYFKTAVAFQSAAAGSTYISCVVTSRGAVITPFIWIAFVTVGVV